MRRAAVLIGCLGLIVLPASARAAINFGSNLSEDAVGTQGCSYGCTVWNTSEGAGTATNGITSPMTGVVTQFTLKKGSLDAGYHWGAVRLRVLTQVFTGSWLGFVPPSAPVQPSDSPGLQTFATRVPITAGSFLGLDVLPGPASGMTAVHSGGSALYAITAPALPTDGSTTGAGESFGELLMQAHVEPDKDCDGRGDQTQDPSIHGTCARKKKCRKHKHRAAESKKKRCKKRKHR